jgi:radical SAM superfamily enzyme YgiQ (UPF0313 family)
MRVAFVSYDASQGRTTGAYPPLHLVALATSVEIAGYEVRVFDYCDLFSKMDAYFQEISDWEPDIVGMTCYTPSLSHFHDVSKRLREYVPSAAMVVGGGHPTVWPEWTLRNLSQFNYAMVGECDRAIVAFVEMIAGARRPEEVPGLGYWRGGEIVVNPRDQILDIDELPQLRRSMLDVYYKQGIYWDMAARGNLDMMITSRGCPYSCSFCFKIERKYRFRSVEHLIVEFEELRRRGVRSIHIQDDAFTAHKKRCHAVAEKLVEGKFKFEIKVRSRVNNVDLELLRALKRAGVCRIIYGFESGAQEVLQSMDKRVTVEQNERAAELTRQAGLACYGEIMIGMPGETPATLQKTTEFLLKYKPIVGGIPVLYPLPGTRVYEDAKLQGTLQGDWSTQPALPWVKLPWTESRSDLERASAAMSRKVQRNIGYVAYFMRQHIPMMTWRQCRFLARRALYLLSPAR